jgi:hypothetical protein
MIPLKYKNKSAILFATGPSLTEEVVETIRPYRGKFVMFGCNDAYTIVDFLDEHYACDNNWWAHRGEHFRELCPTLSSWSQAPESVLEPYNVTHVDGNHKEKLSTNNAYIHYGSNSGFQLLNLAYLMGIRKFLLVGYNMKPSGGKKHFFGDHPAPLNKSSPYTQFVRAFSQIQPEIKDLIINCTPDSALDMFTNKPLKEALND